MKIQIPRNSWKGARTQGFTLIELLVVISIIAILAGFALPVFTSAQKKGRITDSLSNCKQIALALRMYSGDNDGIFPATVAPVPGAAAGNTPPAPATTSNQAFDNLMPKYTTSKKIFGSKASGWCPPAKVPPQTKDNQNVIGAAENDWLYMLGLNDTSDARWPLIATATQPGTPEYIAQTIKPGGVWGGTDAVIGFCDGSAKAISGKEMIITGSGTAATSHPKGGGDDGSANILLPVAGGWMDGATPLYPVTP